MSKNQVTIININGQGDDLAVFLNGNKILTADYHAGDHVGDIYEVANNLVATLDAQVQTIDHPILGDDLENWTWDQVKSSVFNGEGNLITNTPLSDLQRRVAEYYEHGEFSHVQTVEESKSIGDSLFVYSIMEAGEAETIEDYSDMVSRAIGQLNTILLPINDDLENESENKLS